MTVLSLKIVDVGCFISHQHYVGSNHWKCGCLFKSLFRLTTKKYVLVNTQHKGTWRGASMFSLICAWINVWVNNREAGDLRRHRAHYDVIVMLESLVRYPDFVPRSFIIIGVFRSIPTSVQYIPRHMHTVFALLCFVVVIHWLIYPYPSGLLHWHCGNLTIAPVPAKQPWWIWINTSFEFIMIDYITTTKQSTTKPCAYFLGYTVAFHDTAVKVHNIKICSGIIKKGSLGCCTEVNFAVFINNV